MGRKKGGLRTSGASRDDGAAGQDQGGAGREIEAEDHDLSGVPAAHRARAEAEANLRRYEVRAPQR
jgi:hypothetical protein